MARACLLLCLPALVAACRGVERPHRSAAPRDLFVEVAASAGIRFRHENGGRSPLNILQTLGAGGAFLDFDQDGWLDVFLVNGCRVDVPLGARLPRHALYRNKGDGRFTDVSGRAGFGDHLYGIGCAAADYDGDGDPDLLVAGYEGVALYRNNGDGTWTDITARSGLREEGWRTSAAFADVDGDGWLDLYVCGYARFGPQDPQFCVVRGVPISCAPSTYEGDAGHLYRNNGDGTFQDITRAAGAVARDGKSLACVFLDYDGDARPDLFVANDGVANSLFHNRGSLRRSPRGRPPGRPPRLQDVALETGVAYSASGTAEASMAADAADFDSDGRLDLFSTSFQGETDALYRNLGPDGFEYVSREAGLGSTLPYLSFGGGFLDYDNDGDQDLFIASGHVSDRIQEADSACTFAQPRQLYENIGGRFHSVAGGEALARPAVGRGAAFGDYDNDGDTDILVNNNGGTAMLLRNEHGARRHWLQVRLAGAHPNPFGIGARVTVTAGGKRQVREVYAGNSYASSGDPRLLFGLGDAEPRRVEVRWPGGQVQVVDSPPADQELVVNYRRGPARKQRKRAAGARD